jgi:hypothetical protein
MKEPRQGPAAGGAHDPEGESLRAAADLLARILDTAIPIPGTTLRVGLDPLLGLVPGIGDTLASLIGSAILILAARLRVPKIMLIRMSLNVLVNGAIGSIPVAGDAFSVWFQSNARNAALLRRASFSSSRPARMSDWVFVIGILATTLALIGAATIAVVWLIARLWQRAQ